MTRAAAPLMAAKTAAIASPHNDRNLTLTALWTSAILGALVWILIWMSLAPAYAGGTRVKPGEKTRVFVMAGFTPECVFKGYPDIQLDKTPVKGFVQTTPGEAATIQYSLSGNCVGKKVEGTGIYYTSAPGQVGEDTFTVIGRLGTGEPATRTFSVIIDENGKAQ